MGESRKPGACEIYRVNMPLTYLASNKPEKWQIGWLWFSDIIAEIRAHGYDAIVKLIQENDIFIFPRASVQDEPALFAIKEIFDAIHAAGKIIVYEVDDDYTNKHRHVVDGLSIEVAAMADFITVTTNMLGETMKKETGRPYYVLPNCVDEELWDGTPRKGEKLEYKTVIGLTGSKTHYDDWIVLKDVLRTVLNENYDAHLLLMGFHPDYFEGMESTSYIQPMQYIQYSQVIQSCDIILAPVDPNDGFNLGKSPIKAVEGQMAGAAVIATKNPIYKLAVKDQRTGLLVNHDPESWYNAITLLVNDYELRQRLAKSGQAFARKTYSMQKKWKLWDSAYSDMLKKHIKV